jgi:hypothetical protein
MDRLVEIIKQTAREGALVLYTLADPSTVEAIKKACDLWSVPCTDVLRPTVDAIASHIDVAPSGIPRSSLADRVSSHRITSAELKLSISPSSKMMELSHRTFTVHTLYLLVFRALGRHHCPNRHGCGPPKGPFSDQSGQDF